MIPLRVSISALVLSSVAVLAQTDSSKTTAAPVAPQFPACDVSQDDRTLRASGTTKLWQTSNDPVFYTVPGLSACGVKYTDQSNVACVHPGWTNFATVHGSGCNKWIQIFNPDSGVMTQARVIDSCGGQVNSTFGCNDIYLSKRVFEQLAGKQRKELLSSGRLPDSVMWNFITAPCWTCYAGLPSVLPDGTKDSCTGQDNMGFTRCGRKTGGERIVGAASAFVCNQQVDTCDEASAIIPQIPSIANTTKVPATTPMGAAKGGDKTFSHPDSTDAGGSPDKTPGPDSKPTTSKPDAPAPNKQAEPQTKPVNTRRKREVGDKHNTRWAH